MRLADLIEDLDLPPTRVAEDAWALARRRVRRRAATAVGTVAAAVAITVGVLPLAGQDADLQPAPTTPTPTTVVTDPVPPTGVGVVPDELLTPGFRRADYLPLAGAAPRLEVTDPRPLSADPVDRALLAVVPNGLRGDDRWTSIDLLGDDGRWRTLDVPDLVPVHDAGGYEWYVLSPTGLSPDGTELAVPQPHGLVVVDLTTGEHRAYDVPGLSQAASWSDTGHVLVSTEERRTLVEVDLDTGGTRRTSYLPATRVLPDGSPVGWTVGDSGAQPTVPLVDDRVLVGLTSFARTFGTSTRHGFLGSVVLDRATGEVLAARPAMVSNIDFSQLLALQGESVLLAVSQPDSTDQLLLRWDWAERATTVVAVLDAGMTSWAGTVDEAATLVR